MLVRIAKREDPDQTASAALFVYRPFWQAASFDLILLHPSQQSFSYVGTGLPGLN